MSNNTGIKTEKKDNSVFVISLALTVAVVLFALFANDTFTNVVNVAHGFIIGNFNWFYLLAMMIFVAFCIFVAFSKFGKIKLGPDDSTPDYSTGSWFAMLFAAGAGIGLVFWGVAEPITHYTLFQAEGMEMTQAAREATKLAFMHWSFPPWAGYAVVGMALGYFQHRKNMPGLMSSIFVPLIGEKRAKGPIGKAIDIFAVFATVVGVASSLGQGTMQMGSGINTLFGIPNNIVLQLIIIAAITVIYLLISVVGVDKVLSKVSDLNIKIMVGLMIAAFIVGPTVMQLNIFTDTIGNYLNTFIGQALAINPFNPAANAHLNGWTIFYWAWWISWGPFVGSFIASISRGRTIKEFVMGVILLPSIIAFLWFSVFGGLGLNLQNIAPDLIEKIAAAPETALFVALGEYPFGKILSVVGLILLVGFASTSANSGTSSLAVFSSNGVATPPKSRKILWGLVQSGFAAALLISGGLKPLQTFSILGAFPLAIIMVLACLSLYKGLSQDELIVAGKPLEKKQCQIS